MLGEAVDNVALGDNARQVAGFVHNHHRADARHPQPVCEGLDRLTRPDRDHVLTLVLQDFGDFHGASPLLPGTRPSPPANWSGQGQRDAEWPADQQLTRESAGIP